jgi:hypothetical protein
VHAGLGRCQGGAAPRQLVGALPSARTRRSTLECADCGFGLAQRGDILLPLKRWTGEEAIEAGQVWNGIFLDMNEPSIIASW